MRVKRMELQGFKSFKDKTVLHFDHSITGIVGPNGCGKSNVVDAFFWVMGEQSNKHMRAGGSADLIFNGSSKYAPLGFAEATMVLETDVAEGHVDPEHLKDLPPHLRNKEVAVTRRVYRTGEGEYYINGVQARLKDIQELFMDTGIGAKGYSIIAQGEIQKIVNSKPEDRRLLIEEAAGIAKYKARKKESLRKMEAAQANLARLNDVITEIERSLNSLERQAQKAGQYKKYKEELLSKEMTWGRRKNRVLRTRLEELKTRREGLEQELVGLKAELSTSENSIETDRVDQVTLTKSVEELQHVIQDMASDLTRTQSALDLSRRRQSDLASQLEMLQAEQSDLQTAIVTEKEKISGLESENENAASESEAAQMRASEKDEAVRSMRAETETARRSLDQAKRELMQGISEASDLTSRAAGLESRAESARTQIERLATQLSQLQEKVETVRAEAANAQTASAEASEKKTRLHSEARMMTAENETQEQELKMARRDLEESNRNLTRLRSKLQSLEELEQAYEGFGDGPKAILEWAKNQGKESSLRALADGLDVQPGYEACLEGWLEGRLENIVTDDAALALEAIRDLQSTDQGRAAIALAAMPAASGASFDTIRSALTSAGFAVEGSLDQFITPNAKLSGASAQAAARFVQNVAVVADMAALPSFIASGGMESLQGWAIVARDGSALDREGMLRGGSLSSDNQASVLGRKRAITELTAQVEEASQAFAAQESRVNEMSERLDVARARHATLRADMQAAEIEAATLERDVHQMNRSLKEAEGQAELAEYEHSEMKAEAEDAIAKRMEVSEKLEAVVSKRGDLEARIASEEATVTNLEETLRQGEEELSMLRIQEASVRERANSIKRELESGLNLIRDRERRLSDVERALERAQSENAEHTGGDTDQIVKIEELTRELGEKRASLSEFKNLLEITNAKVSGAMSRIKELHSTGDAKTSEANQLSLDIERITAELSHLIQNLEEKYGAGCLDNPETAPIQEEMTDPVITAEMSAEDERMLSEDVERLREKIRRLGEVNPTAIEEYEEKKKRFDHLMSEKGDLETSIQNLNDAIEHINKTSEERFRRAFEAIADRFERLFPIIFGGGMAKLSLVYPEGSNDILEAGVDILAQPPGKKIVNIGLLSGGEKALTAVSMIFAIFMVKPSPFCVLDEVDAPLDDANIGKFNALLREMSAKSQFIVITHNKKTMELNDTLYGVTMEEPGVSKMVSIELH